MPGTRMGHSLLYRLRKSENPIGICVVVLLSWIAASDGRISEEEEQSLQEIARAGGNHSDLTLAIEAAKRGHVRELKLVCEIGRKLVAEQRGLFLEMAVGVAIADGYLTISENHILRFLADLLGFSPSQFEALFQRMANRPFPLPGDPSTVEWWNQRESAGTGERTHRRSGFRSSGEMTEAEALAVLGLESSATLEQIKAAYRRMAKAHHPDKFASLGPEAVKAATITFTRIKKAYDLLTGS